MLKDKGLVIGDEVLAVKWLNHVSYFRFKNFSYTFKDYNGLNGNYIPGTTFEHVIDLYQFDRKLKVIVFAAIENIEVAVKTIISNTMSCKNGPHWYIEEKHFLDRKVKSQTRSISFAPENAIYFDHNEFLAKLENDCKNPNEIFLQHYVKNYTPIYPPSWMLMDLMTFGTLSLLFENLQPSEEKTTICESFGLTKAQLVSWLHAFAYIRNRCVHHSRLVYDRVKFAPALPVKTSRKFLIENDLVRHNSIYACLCCIQFILNTCNSSSDFKSQLKELINSYPHTNYDLLGFTPNWKTENLWN